MENVCTKEKGMKGEANNHQIEDFNKKNQKRNIRSFSYQRTSCEERQLIDSSNRYIPKESPFFMMTNAYHTSGSADDLMQVYKQSEHPLLIKAQLAYYRGDIEETYKLILQCKKLTLPFYEHINVGLILGLCAMEYGNSALWEEARNYIAQCPCHNEKDAEMRYFFGVIIDCLIFDMHRLPNWFQQGCFDSVPIDCYPCMRFLYVNYILVSSRYALSNAKSESNVYRVLMQSLAGTCELLISQTKLEKAILAEIYLRIICAIAYHNYGKDSEAIAHLNQAIHLALPDRLFRPFVEYQWHLDFLLEQAFGKIDKDIWNEIKYQFKKFIQGWIFLHNLKLNESMSKELTIREREVSRLAVNGLSNAEIAERLHISLNTVKHTVQHAMEKTGTKKRSDLIKFI